jgi:hypothetical protein
MSTVGQPESATQNRVISLFRDELDYKFLGDWTDRTGNSNIEEGLLTAYLSRSGYSQAQISVATHKLRTEADNHSRTLYGNNQAVYKLLRYGVPVKIEADTLAVGLTEELVYIMFSDVMTWGVTFSMYRPVFAVLMLENKIDSAINTPAFRVFFP